MEDGDGLVGPTREGHRVSHMTPLGAREYY